MARITMDARTCLFGLALSFGAGAAAAAAGNASLGPARAEASKQDAAAAAPKSAPVPGSGRCPQAGTIPSTDLPWLPRNPKGSLFTPRRQRWDT